MAILNNNKSSKMEVATIDGQFQFNGEIRYNISLENKIYQAIPLMTGPPLRSGDKVIVLFEQNNIRDTPFIIGKFNQKTPDSELIKPIEIIKKQKDHNAIIHETDYSFIKMDSKRKKITIGNKDTIGQIVIDENNVFVGDVNLTDLINKMKDKVGGSFGNETLSSGKNLKIEAEGSIFNSASEIKFLSSNFMVINDSEMMVETPHLNLTSSFLEFNVITPKGYDLKQKNAFNFFAVDGNFAISLGKGDFNLKSVSPASEFNFLISPLTPFSDASGSLIGLSLSSSGFLTSHFYGSNMIELSSTSFTTELLSGMSAINLSSTSFGVDLNFGVVSMSLSSTSFKVTIAGNSMTLSPSGLSVDSGDITATGGDVKALGGSYSLMKHKHPTAVPGGPSPPLPS